MVTARTEMHSNLPVFTYEFVQYTVWVLSYLIQRALLQKTSHSSIKWGNKLVNGSFQKLELVQTYVCMTYSFATKLWQYLYVKYSYNH